MKLLPVLTIASLFLIPIAHADNHRDHQMPMVKGEHMMDTPVMQSDLNLSTEQKQKVQAIHEDATKKHQEVREETHTKVLTVLTPEQGKKLEEHRAKKMEQRTEKMEKRTKQMDKRSKKLQQRAEKMQTPTTAPTPAQ